MLQSDTFLVPNAIDTTSNVTSVQGPTLKEPDTPLKARTRNKTTTKRARKVDNRCEAKVLSCKTQDATSITSLAWDEVDKSVFTPITPNSTSSAPPSKEASISHESGASTDIAAQITQDMTLFKKLGRHLFLAQ